VLESGSPRTRASAAQALAHVEDARASTWILAALNDPDQWVRYFAARSIGRRPFPESVDALGRLAESDPANQVRIAAIEALARIGGARVMAILAGLVESNDIDLARAALAGLGHIGHPDALPPLLATVRSGDPDRRMHAVRALGERGGEDALDSLRWVAASDTDERVVQAAIDALARLATAGAIDTLVALTSDPARRDACVAALARLGKEHIEVIGCAWDLAAPEARQALVAVLGRMKQPRASELLSAALDDPDDSVRLAAVNALAHLGSRAQERKLVTMARADSDPKVRRAAQKALQR